MMLQTYDSPVTVAASNMIINGLYNPAYSCHYVTFVRAVTILFCRGIVTNCIENFLPAGVSVSLSSGHVCVLIVLILIFLQLVLLFAISFLMFLARQRLFILIIKAFAYFLLMPGEN